MGYEKYLKNYLCPHCHIGFLVPHPESRIYLKCPFCAFTKEAPVKKKNDGTSK